MCRHTHVRFRDEEEEKPSSKPQPEQRSIHFYAVLLVLLCAVKLFKSPGQNNVMCSHVPNIIDDLQVDDFAFSQTFATGTAVAALVQPALGVLLDARGVRFCIPMGLIGLAAGLGGLSLVKPPAPYYQLVASWFLIRSTAIGCIEACCNAAIALWFTSYRGRAMAMLQIVAGLPTSAVTAVMIASDDAIGWRATLRLTACSLLALAAVCACLIPSSSKRRSSSSSNAAASSSPPAVVCEMSDAADVSVGETPPTPTSAVALEQQQQQQQQPVASTLGTAKVTEGNHLSSPSLCGDAEGDRGVVATPRTPAIGSDEPAAAETEGIPSHSDASPSVPRPWISRRSFTLLVLFSSTGWATTIYGGVDLFTVEMARGGKVEGEASYDVSTLVFLPMGFVVSATCLACGCIIDRGVPPIRVSSAGVLLSGVSALCATKLDTPLGGVTYALTRGLSSGMVAASSGLLIPYFFGTRKLGRLLGGQSLCYVLGTCVGSLLLGMAPESLGSFSPMLKIMATPALVLALLQCTLRRRSEMVDK